MTKIITLISLSLLSSLTFANSGLTPSGIISARQDCNLYQDLVSADYKEICGTADSVENAGLCMNSATYIINACAAMEIGRASCRERV